MEEPKNQIVHGKLNLDVPPLSTRRAPGSSAKSGSRVESATMVPFSWERVPGEPKDVGSSDEWSSIEWSPPPKPPPGRRQPGFRDDEGYRDHKNGEEEGFWDAMDIFSLAESVDDEEEYCKATKERSSVMMESKECCTTSFMIERFLPDAQALAQESVLNRKGRSHPPIKGCGLATLWHWTFKSKPCSVKSPVCDATHFSHKP